MAMLRLLYAELGVRRLLHEGGPTLFGQFLAVEAIDELFLTLSPQIAGRKEETIRPGLVEGIDFMPDRSPGFQLLSVKQRAEHLYLRYGRCSVAPEIASCSPDSRQTGGRS